MRLVMMALVATYVALVFQTALAPLMRVFGAAPDLLVLAAMAIVLLSASPYAFLWCGWIGLLHDLASTGRLGVGMFWFALSGYLVARIRDALYAERFWGRSVAAFVGSFVAVAGLVVTRRVLGDTDAQWETILAYPLRVAAYTAIVALPFFAVWGWRARPRAGAGLN